MTDEAAFLDLSVELTGFGMFDLVATGLADAHYGRVVEDADPPTLLNLLTVWRDIARHVPPDQSAAAVAARIMADPTLARAAQQIIALWYVGSWYSQPPSVSSVVSAEAYVEGLMWKAMESHPMAAKPQGYGAWSLPPPTMTADML